MSNDFRTDLAWSHAQSDQPWWEEVYRQAFPDFSIMHDVRADGWAQRGGIDRQVLLTDGTVLKIDEKCRRDDWPDFAMEIWSDKRAKRMSDAWPAERLDGLGEGSVIEVTQPDHWSRWVRMPGGWWEIEEGVVRSLPSYAVVSLGSIRVVSVSVAALLSLGDADLYPARGLKGRLAQGFYSGYMRAAITYVTGASEDSL